MEPLSPQVTSSAAVMATATACASDPPSAKQVTKADYGDGWPLTVDSGTVECRNGQEVVFTHDGTTYALNGTAKGTGKYADVDRIWADDPAVPGLKLSVGDLIDAGRALC